LIEYATTSGTAYSGSEFPAGYHSLQINGEIVRGQRDCALRHVSLGIEWADMVVLDLGCNQGGMLFEIADAIKYGYGIDRDSRMINVCHKLREMRRLSHVNFFVADLERELSQVDSLLRHEVDVCMLLSMCNWITNWAEVMSYCRSLAPTLVLETNGDPASQAAQQAHARRIFQRVRVASTESLDDQFERQRTCLVCTA